MRRYARLIISLLLIMLFALSGCAGKHTPQPTSTPPVVQTPARGTLLGFTSLYEFDKNSTEVPLDFKRQIDDLIQQVQSTKHPVDNIWYHVVGFALDGEDPKMAKNRAHAVAKHLSDHSIPSARIEQMEGALGSCGVRVYATFVSKKNK